MIKIVSKFTKDEAVLEEAIKSTCTIDRDRQVVKIKKEIQQDRMVDRAFMSWSSAIFSQITEGWLGNLSLEAKDEFSFGSAGNTNINIFLKEDKLTKR